MASAQEPHLCKKASLQAPEPGPAGLPVTLSAQGHEDFPRNFVRSELLVCALRGHASSAPHQSCMLTDSAHSENAFHFSSLPGIACICVALSAGHVVLREAHALLATRADEEATSGDSRFFEPHCLYRDARYLERSRRCPARI